MADRALRIALSIATLFAAGAIAGVGIRAAEWAIPKPETRVMVCFAADTIETCKSLSTLLERYLDRKGATP